MLLKQFSNNSSGSATRSLRNCNSSLLTAKHAYPGLETVVFCAFTHEEQMMIRNLVEQGLYAGCR